MKSKAFSLGIKLLLQTIFSNSVKCEKTTLPALSNYLSLEKDYLKMLSEQASELNFVKEKKEGLQITDLGRKQIQVVLCGGVFDVIHHGHIYTLSESKLLGDVLVVSVARDMTVLKVRAKAPLNNEKQRVKLVSALKPVDVAILGSEKDILETVDKLRPDVISLGYDQHHNEKKLLLAAKAKGIDLSIVRLDSPDPGAKTSIIKENRESLQWF